ncbi:MAG TPA: hypothetical protein VLI72_15380 [Methylibium sp.]|nr:hypothetical protein [Methylibium sp.]
MTTEQDFEIGDDAVLQRTALGARALLFDHVELDRGERQLLGVVTGYTTLGDLFRLGLDARRARPAAKQLMVRGLLSRTEH